MARTSRFEIGSPTTEKLRVFLCHARDDAALADGIAAGLDYDGGFEVWIDRAADQPHESKRGRLGSLIAAADAVVLLLTPRSAASPDCRWELDEAGRLAKRILPVLAEPLGATPPPEQLSAVTPVRLDPQDDGTPRSFMTALAALRAALNADPDWLRAHTRLLNRAQQWEATNRAEHRLLTGRELIAAEAWLEQRPKDAPSPLELQRAFIEASRRAETAPFLPSIPQPKRSWTAPVGVALLFCLALGAAWLALRNHQAAQFETERAEAAQRAAALAEASAETARLAAQERRAASAVTTAEQQRRAAQARVEAATARSDRDRGAAMAARQAAEAELASARIEQSRAFAEASAAFRQNGELDKAAAMAWLALPHDPELSERPVTAQALGALRQARDRTSLRRTLLGDQSWVFAVAFTPDGRTIATSGEDGLVLLRDAESGQELLTLRGHLGGMTAYSHGGRAVFASGVTSLAFARNGRSLLTGGADGTARLWDAADGAELLVLRGHQGPVLDVAFSPDGKTLATAAGDETARLWISADGTPLHVVGGHGTLVDGVAFSPDGATLATCGEDGTARLWNTATGAQVRVMSGHEGTVRRVAFSPDGRTLATGGDDGTARLWSTIDGGERQILRGHVGPVASVAFSPGGEALATGGEDALAKLWDVGSGAEIGVLRGHEKTASGGVFDVAFAPDGNTVLTGGADGTTRLWDVSEPNRRSKIPLAEFIAETGDSLRKLRPLTKADCLALQVESEILCPEAR